MGTEELSREFCGSVAGMVCGPMMVHGVVEHISLYPFPSTDGIHRSVWTVRTVFSFVTSIISVTIDCVDYLDCVVGVVADP